MDGSVRPALLRDLRKHLTTPQPDGYEGDEDDFTVVLLHHAGGSSASFAPMQSHFPAGWRLRAVELPGRATASRYPPCRTTDEAVAALVPAVLEEVPGPYAVFGHSLGALVAYECVRELERTGRPPLWLGVSGMSAPGRVSARFADRRDLWSREGLIDFMRKVGGTPDEILEDTEIADYMVRILRADLRIVDTYTHEQGPPLGVPLSVFSGLQDPVASPEAIEGWEAYSTGPVAHHLLPGGHFYLFEDMAGFARCVTADIEAAREKTRSPLPAADRA